MTMSALTRLLSLGARALVWCLPVSLGLVAMLASPPLAETLRNLVFDQYQRVEPRRWTPDLPVRVVAIDDASLLKFGQWPWPRKLLADLAERLAAQGAAAIAFDIVFAEEDRTAPASLLARLPALPERDAYARALEAHGFDARENTTRDDLAETFRRVPSVLALVLTQDETRVDVPAKTGFATAGDDPAGFLARFTSAVLPLPKLSEPAAGLGAINWTPDRDLVVRKVPLLFALRAHADPGSISAKPDLIASLDAEVLRVAQHAQTLIVKSSNASGTTGYGAKTGIVAIKIGALEIATEADASVRVHFAGMQPRRLLSAARVLAGAVPDDEIAGRIMLIGATASALADVRSTPLAAAVPGTDIHAEVLEHILSGARLARPDYAVGLEALLLVVGGLACTLFARFTPAAVAAIAVLALLAALWAASFICFSRADLLFDPLLPGATWLLAYVGMTVMVYRRSERQRQFVRAAFSRYLAPALVARLAADPTALKLGGEARDVTVLFTDMRNFTRRAEKIGAVGAVDLLNRVHTPLTQAVLAEFGTIDKYLGDGLMAFWNAPLDVADHADHACRAALAMQAALPAINADLAAQPTVVGYGDEPVEIGIGINTGEVFVGNLGSQQRFDYSIVGDPVNVAARLEAATKDFCVPILVSASTARAAEQFLFLPLGEIAIKGRAETTEVFALHAAKPAPADFSAFAALHAKTVAAAKSRAAYAQTLVEMILRHPYARPYGAYYAMLLRDLAAHG